MIVDTITCVELRKPSRELTNPASDESRAGDHGIDRIDALVKFDRPTLIIASADSPELEAQKAMLAKLPNGQFTSVAEAGHAVFVDQPSR